MCRWVVARTTRFEEREGFIHIRPGSRFSKVNEYGLHKDTKGREAVREYFLNVVS